MPPTEVSSLVDPFTVSVIGVVGDATSEKSPAMPPEKNIKKDKAPTKAKKEKASTSASDDRISQLDQKWSERFNRLEALLLSKSLQPTFSSEVRVSPSHSPPANVARDTEPFFQPTNRTKDVSSTPQRTGPDSTATKQKSAGKLQSEHHRPKSSTGRTGPDTATVRSKSTGMPHTDSHQPSSLPAKSTSTSLTDPPLTDRPLNDRPKPAFTTGSDSQRASRRDSISSIESEADSDFSDRPPVELFLEEGELSDEQELTEHDLPTSEEQTYRETMRGIRSFMGWSHVPDVDSSNPSDDNPFAGPKTPAPSSVSVQMPTEEWLCKKLSRLNINLVEGFPSKTAEAGSLPMDHFLRPPRSQANWDGLYSDQPADPTKVSSWYTGHCKLNNSFGRISRKAALASTPPASRRISQDTLRRWKRTAREASVVCNQAASFNRCLFKVQKDMQTQLKTIRSESKGKRPSKSSKATDELLFLMEFNSSITQAAAKAMEHVIDFVFITMGNLTLVRCDAYLNHVKNGIKPDTLGALRTAPLHISTLFLDAVIKRAEEEIAHYDNKGQSTASSSHHKGRFHPYERHDKRAEGRSEAKQERPAWKNIGRRQFRRGRGKNSNFSSRSAKGQQSHK